MDFILIFMCILFGGVPVSWDISLSQENIYMNTTPISPIHQNTPTSPHQSQTRTTISPHTQSCSSSVSNSSVLVSPSSCRFRIHQTLSSTNNTFRKKKETPNLSSCSLFSECWNKIHAEHTAFRFYYDDKHWHILSQGTSTSAFHFSLPVQSFRVSW